MTELLVSAFLVTKKPSFITFPHNMKLLRPTHLGLDTHIYLSRIVVYCCDCPVTMET